MTSYLSESDPKTKFEIEKVGALVLDCKIHVHFSVLSKLADGCLAMFDGVLSSTMREVPPHMSTFYLQEARNSSNLRSYNGY